MVSSFHKLTTLLLSLCDYSLNVYFFCLDKGVSIYWLGDFVFVESGLGVRVKFDLTNTVYVTVTSEHKWATRGLCGVHNGNADGEKCADALTLHDPLSCSCKCSTIFHYSLKSISHSTKESRNSRFINLKINGEFNLK